MADKATRNEQQQNRRNNYSEEKKREYKEKNKISTAKSRKQKKKTNESELEPSASLRPDDSELEPAAAFTPSLSDDAVETPEPCTSSSSSNLKRRKIVLHEDENTIVDVSAQESKSYDFFQLIPQTDFSHVTDQQQVLISSSITQTLQPPPTKVRNENH